MKDRMLVAYGMIIFVSGVSATERCCQTCASPKVKYYSVDVPHGFCGEACIDPKSFGTFKKFEPNLTLIDEATPGCAKQFTPDGKYYTDYASTVTHGDPFGILAVTLDLYAPQGAPDHSCCSTDFFGKQLVCNLSHKPVKLTVDGTGPFCCPIGATEKEPCPKTQESNVLGTEKKWVELASSAEPCCQTCASPKVKYYSVDVPHGFCGEACIDPKSFGTFKKFEPNLTLIDEATPGCAKQFTPDGKYYTDYASTVTHGDPFGILAVTLDLYAPQGAPDHSCCSTDFFGKQLVCNLSHKPVKLTVDGTGPFCCPMGATEKEPCPKTQESNVLGTEKKWVELASSAETCCQTCASPKVKYYSVDVPHGFCGEACIDPKSFGTFKKFEPNLTLIDEATPGCAKQFTPDGKYYTDYASTVTHGDPFGILAVTLDLYAPQGAPDHSCCSTDFFDKQMTCNLLHKPMKLTVDGTGPFCCPPGATEKEPCPKQSVSINI